MKRKKLIIGILILILVGGGWFYFSRQEKKPAETYTAGLKDVVQVVSATGELKADSEIALNFETIGRIATVKTDVGREVAAGDSLAMLESQTLSQEVANAKAALDRAIAQADINDDEVRRLESLVENAEKFLDDTESVEDKKQDATDQDVDDTERAYRDAQDYYDQVVTENGASSATAKSAKLTVDNALRSFNTAKSNRETTKKSSDLAITSAKNSLDSAKETLLKAKSDNQTIFDDATVAAAQAQYQLALQNLEKATLNAPVGGVITKVNFKKGEVLGSAQATPFARMVTKDLLIEANIAESDIAKIKLGNKGTVTFDALGDEEIFNLEVVSIEPASTVIQDVVYYIVSFSVQPGSDVRLKPGMTANIDVETNKKLNVIAIPERLVQEDEQGKYVDLTDQTGQVRRADIKTGLRGEEGIIEVVSGLKNGDQVVAPTVQ